MDLEVVIKAYKSKVLKDKSRIRKRYAEKFACTIRTLDYKINKQVMFTEEEFDYFQYLVLGTRKNYTEGNAPVAAGG